MVTPRVERRLAAILIADVVGYSSLIEHDEAGTLATWSAFRRAVLEPLLSEYRGRLFKLLGDGVLAEFASVVDAVSCAVELQRRTAEQQPESPHLKRIVLRIGINLGDVVVDDGDLLGDGVNVAARLEQLCEPGGVLISGTAYDHLQGRFSLPLEFTGEQSVKNLSRPVRTYRVALGGSKHGLRLRFRPYARVTKLAAAIAALAAAAAISWVVFTRPAGEGGSTIPSIAVLPFNDLSGQPELSYLGNGVADDIITMLSRVPELKVLARGSSFTKDGHNKDLRALGSELGVSHVLQGSVRKDGERIRLVAELANTATGQQVWAERFDRSGTDPLELQDEITERIVTDLVGDTGTLRLLQYREAWGKDSAGLQEYDYYLRAHDLLRRLLPETNEQAFEVASEGLSKYPRSPLLKLELAYVYFLRGWNNWSEDLTSEYQKAGQLVREAMSEPALSPLERRLGHFLSSFVAATGREFSLALGEAEAAIALSPYDVYMLGALSQIPIMCGKPALALEWVDRASSLDTNPDISQELALYRGWALLVQGDDQGSLEALSQDQRRDSALTPLLKAIALKRLGRMEEANEELRNGLTIEPKFSQATWRELFFYSDPSIVDREVDDLAALGLPGS